MKEECFQAGDPERERGVLVAEPLLEVLTLRADRKMIDGAVYAHCYEQLAGKTWADAYRELLQKINARLDSPPAFILLTGGASRMEFTETICREVFSDKANVPLKHESAPETTVASGLARTGRWLQRCRAFNKEIEDSFTVNGLKGILKPEVPQAFKAFLLKTSRTCYEHIMPICIEEWQEGNLKAADGLAKAFREKGRAWEASEKGRQTKNETAQQLIKVVLDHVEENAKEIARRYKIPPNKLDFRIDVGDVPCIVQVEKLLEDKLYVALDQTAGEVLDWARKEGWGNFWAWVSKKGLWFAGKMDTLSIKVIGGLVVAAEAERLTQRLAEELHSQMLEQFWDQQKSVLPWIR